MCTGREGDACSLGAVQRGKCTKQGHLIAKLEIGDGPSRDLGYTCSVGLASRLKDDPPPIITASFWGRGECGRVMVLNLVCLSATKPPSRAAEAVKQKSWRAKKHHSIWVVLRMHDHP